MNTGALRLQENFSLSLKVYKGYLLSHGGCKLLGMELRFPVSVDDLHKGYRIFIQ